MLKNSKVTCRSIIIWFLKLGALITDMSTLLIIENASPIVKIGIIIQLSQMLSLKENNGGSSINNASNPKKVTEQLQQIQNCKNCENCILD